MTLTPFEQTAEAIPYLGRHSFLLHGLVRWLRPEVVVEVGTHIGHTAAWLARGLQENNQGRLYCIDNFCWVNETQEEQWETNLRACGVRDWVTLVKGRSEEVAWPERVDFAFIDGNHTYDVCRHDVLKARSLGATCIAIHDVVSWEGSRKYAEEMREQERWEADNVSDDRTGVSWFEWDFMEAETDCGILVAKKRFPKGPCEGRDIGEKWDVPNAAA
jgi:predicted O-methyltransferase YrrM